MNDDKVNSKDLAVIYEKTQSIEETILEYVEDELLGLKRPTLERFEIVVDALKKFALGVYDNHPKCKRSRNDIEMAVILWVHDEKKKEIKREDLLKKLNVLGDFMIDEVKKRLRRENEL